MRSAKLREGYLPISARLLADPSMLNDDLPDMLTALNDRRSGAVGSMFLASSISFSALTDLLSF
jgi:cobalamin synthase